MINHAAYITGDYIPPAVGIPIACALTIAYLIIRRMDKK